MINHYLFTYGLLRKNAGHKMSKFLSDNAMFFAEGTYQGKLFLIEYYPGVLPSDDPQDQVVGDIFKLHHPRLLTELDSFEGIGKEHAIPHEYQRMIQPVNCLGKVIEAWVYVYNWKIRPERRILSGDFLKN